MTPEAFIQKWQAADLTERSAAQQHFLDLCEVLGEGKPAELDPKGEWYCFERGATKTRGTRGWADVWKRGCFAWEYKRPGENLDDAIAQLQQYALALDNPPLLIASDLKNFLVRTNWTYTVSERIAFPIAELRDSNRRRFLKSLFSNPEEIRPGKTRQALTEDAAEEFVALAQRLRDKGHPPPAVAHFVNRLVFCMFAQNVGLLPNNMFMEMLEAARATPTDFQGLAAQLFGAMKGGGLVGFKRIDWFNGGLFDDEAALPLDRTEIDRVIRSARLDWSEIDPSLIGTLFERGLDPGKRAQLGAHYTDRGKIMLIVEPVIVRPWLDEWTATREKIEKLLTAAAGKQPAQREKARKDGQKLYDAFVDRLVGFRVLDPACGSGNFLYLALHALKDIEHRAGLEAEALGLQRALPRVGPEALKGIEINAYAAELARVSVWIGEIQWMRKNGYDVSRQPILRPLDTIECRDAVLTEDGKEALWPQADVIVGNPPFLGAKKLLSGLGKHYVAALRSAYKGRLDGFTDLVTYWFERTRTEICGGRARRAGLVATNSIRGGTNLPILKRISESTHIYEAWSDEDWTLDGAAVRVSLVCFESGELGTPPRLNGDAVDAIGPDLTAAASGAKFSNFTAARRLTQNRNVAFLGIQKTGPFEIPGLTAREWLSLPTNPDGRQNSDVLRPYWNGIDVTRRPRDTWIVDFKGELDERRVALYEAPYSYLAKHVKPTRTGKREERANIYWWLHYWPRPEMRAAIKPLARCLVTPEVSKHRVFVWLRPPILPDKNLIVVARQDDLTFGVLSSRFHIGWALKLGTTLEDRPRYTSTTTFETFPFPEGLTPDATAKSIGSAGRAERVAAAAKRLNGLRQAWLNPPDLVERVPEVVPGFPDRIVPKDAKAAAILKKRTLTNLYNERPAWLDLAHKELDAAVAAAYGWPEDIETEDALARLLALNLERST